MNRHDMMVDLEKLLRIVFRQLRSEVGELFGRELTGNEFRILAMLMEEGSMRATDVAKHLEVSASHVTALTDDLLSKGYIERHKSEMDRRIVEIVVTKEGKEAFTQFEQQKSDYFRERFSHFTNEELLILNTLFRKMDKTSIDE
ncbi:MarR family winged helix-turn-helix transcriptional regulator [Bacillus songklensis]|uniref:MarR family winged helix-turn-helix transcriptional regulator n=1 Tax=Bacillus songklensis TaxID=1069116 RepID=A0ABV8AZI3_9BACI